METVRPPFDRNCDEPTPRVRPRQARGLIDSAIRRKHGIYRPNLAKLVASNSVKDVRETTKAAFATYDADNADYAKSITTLSKMKGIGPATASLLLSCYDPVTVPFFSDELFRYLHWEEAKSKGWDRKINYTAKEYKALFERLQTLRERLEKESKTLVPAIDIEKAAYVLGKEATSASKFPVDEEDAKSDAALQPPSPKRRKKATPKPKDEPEDEISLGVRRVEECRRKRLNGSPTYDELGYELDKEFSIKHTGGRPRPLGKRALERLEQKGKDRERKAKILGMKDSGDVRNEDAWDDRVARDLGITFHKVGMKEYEECTFSSESFFPFRWCCLSSKTCFGSLCFAKTPHTRRKTQTPP